MGLKGNTKMPEMGTEPEPEPQQPATAEVSDEESNELYRKYFFQPGLSIISAEQCMEFDLRFDFAPNRNRANQPGGETPCCLESTGFLPSHIRAMSGSTHTATLVLHSQDISSKIP